MSKLIAVLCPVCTNHFHFILPDGSVDAEEIGSKSRAVTRLQELVETGVVSQDESDDVWEETVRHFNLYETLDDPEIPNLVRKVVHIHNDDHTACVRFLGINTNASTIAEVP